MLTIFAESSREICLTGTLKVVNKIRAHGTVIAGVRLALVYI